MKNLGTWYRPDVFLFEHEPLASGEVLVGRYVARLHVAEPTRFLVLAHNGVHEHWMHNTHKDDPSGVYLTDKESRITEQVNVIMTGHGFTRNKALAMRWAMREAYIKETAGRVEEQEQARLGELGGKICY